MVTPSRSLGDSVDDLDARVDPFRLLRETEVDPATLHRRHQLLEAIANCISDVLTTDSIKASLPSAMERIARVVKVDRMLVVEMRPTTQGAVQHAPYFVWAAPGVTPLVDPSDLVEDGERDVVIDWMGAVHEGKIVFGSQRTSSPALRRFLERLNVISTLLVPIMIRGKHWGQIGFDDCNNEHDWTPDEINTLKLLADVIGVAITRERSMDELLETHSQMQSIFQAIPDVMFRLRRDGTIISVKAGSDGARSPQQWAGHRFQECWLQQSRDEFPGILQRVIDNKSMVCIEHSDGVKGQESFHEIRLVPLAGDEAIAITRNITERKRSEAELAQMHRELAQASREAGMAEIANNVLHNVGNALNSVTVSASVIGGRMRESKFTGLTEAVELLNEHRSDLGNFLTVDDRGKVLPGYLNKLAVILAAERRSIGEELESMTKSIDHIKTIVASQQSYAGSIHLLEPARIEDLLEQALRMKAASLVRNEITVTKDFAADVPLLLLDRHLILQILLNLIGNAVQAMRSPADPSHQIILRTKIAEVQEGARLRICVEDDGEGIPSANLPRLFSHGFTTRPNGHGFGLHSCALAAKEMGGSMAAHSDGPGKGAVFTLDLPLNPANPPGAVP